jgi:potassium-transporting ATPase KdpC subunit
MNRLPNSARQLLAALRGLLLFTVICGILYPLVVFGIAQAAFHKQANGSLVTDKNGRVVGSSLLCQEFVDAKGNPLPQYFQPRPSYAIVGWALGQKDGKWVVEGTGPNNYGCNPLYSSASNLSPDNPAQIQFVKQQQAQISAFDHVKISQIPANAVQASGSGMDPDISPANAAIQVDRVAAARHVSPAAIRALVAKYTAGRTLGFLGEPVVNVLLLNIALDEKYPV